MDTDLVFNFLAYLVLGALLFVVLFIVGIILKATLWKKKAPKCMVSLTAWFQKNGLLFAFIVSLFSVLTSLFMSEIAFFEPCTLCWWQRGFMFPLPIIIGILLWKGRGKFIALAMSIIGGFISLYHWIVQLTDASTACRVVFDATGAQTSCNQAYLMYFGFLSIPLMTFTAFAMIALFLAVYKK